MGLGVDDLAAAYAYCQAQGCTITAEPITAEPVDAAHGDRVFECIDPFCYLWEMSQPVASVPAEEALRNLGADWSERTSEQLVQSLAGLSSREFRSKAVELARRVLPQAVPSAQRLRLPDRAGDGPSTAAIR